MAGDKADLNRRLEQSQRMISEAFDPLTKDRLRGLSADLEGQIAAADADGPADAGNPDASGLAFKA